MKFLKTATSLLVILSISMTLVSAKEGKALSTGKDAQVLTNSSLQTKIVLSGFAPLV